MITAGKNSAVMSSHRTEKDLLEHTIFLNTPFYYRIARGPVQQTIEDRIYPPQAAVATVQYTVSMFLIRLLVCENVLITSGKISVLYAMTKLMQYVMY